MTDWKENLITDASGIASMLRDTRTIAVLGIKPETHADQAAHYVPLHMAEAGYEIVDLPTPGFTRAMELWFAMQMPEIRVFLWPAIEQFGDLGIRRAMRLMLDAHPAEDGVPYMKALAERARVVREWQLFFDRVPLVLAPVCTQPVYRRGFDVESVERTAEVWRECTTLTAIPVLGVPALAVPTGVVDGLPVGVTVMAARFREDGCLPAGEAIEARAGLAARMPVDIAW